MLPGKGRANELLINFKNISSVGHAEDRIAEFLTWVFSSWLSGSQLLEHLSVPFRLHIKREAESGIQIQALQHGILILEYIPWNT